MISLERGPPPVLANLGGAGVAHVSVFRLPHGQLTKSASLGGESEKADPVGRHGDVPGEPTQ